MLLYSLFICIITFSFLCLWLSLYFAFTEHRGVRLSLSFTLFNLWFLLFFQLFQNLLTIVMVLLILFFWNYCPRLFNFYTSKILRQRCCFANSNTLRRFFSDRFYLFKFFFFLFFSTQLTISLIASFDYITQHFCRNTFGFSFLIPMIYSQLITSSSFSFLLLMFFSTLRIQWLYWKIFVHLQSLFLFQISHYTLTFLTSSRHIKIMLNLHTKLNFEFELTFSAWHTFAGIQARLHSIP